MLRARQRSAICLAALATILAASSWVPPDRVVGWLVDAGELLREVSEPVGGDAVGVGPSRASRVAGRASRARRALRPSRHASVLAFHGSSSRLGGGVHWLRRADKNRGPILAQTSPGTRSRSQAGSADAGGPANRLGDSDRGRSSPSVAATGSVWGLEVPSSHPEHPD